MSIANRPIQKPLPASPRIQPQPSTRAAVVAPAESGHHTGAGRDDATGAVTERAEIARHRVMCQVDTLRPVVAQLLEQRVGSVRDAEPGGADEYALGSFGCCRPYRRGELGDPRPRGVDADPLPDASRRVPCPAPGLSAVESHP